MGFEFKIRDQGAVHFLTFTVHQWVDVFTRKDYSDLLLRALFIAKRVRIGDLFMGNYE